MMAIAIDQQGVRLADTMRQFRHMGNWKSQNLGEVRAFGVEGTAFRTAPGWPDS